MNSRFRPAPRPSEIMYGPDVLPEPPPVNYALHSYVLRVYKCQCRACGHVSVSSVLFDLYALVGGRGRKLSPTKYIEPSLPTSIEQMEITSTPICHECVATSSPLPTTEQLYIFGKRFLPRFQPNGPSNFDPEDKKKKVAIKDIPVEDLDL